ncbi:MAG: putative leader peptide [Gemmatimonadota bacterium]
MTPVRVACRPTLLVSRRHVDLLRVSSAICRACR